MVGTGSVCGGCGGVDRDDDGREKDGGDPESEPRVLKGEGCVEGSGEELGDRGW
jgi:hypothetical protein